MALRPLIGLSGRRKKVGDLPGYDKMTGLVDLDVDLYFSDYGRAILDAGGLPVNIPLDVDPAEIAARLDGVLLSGGADVDPARYGAVADPDLGAIEPERDAFELALVDAALSNSLPTLGICRGIQVLNVHGGGSLHQHVAPHAIYDQSPTITVHPVSIAADSTLAGLYGSTHAVNSLHHQTLDTVAPGFRVVATSDDGTIEAIEAIDRPIVAVQWHPEMMATRATDPIFSWLVKTASGRLAAA